MREIEVDGRILVTTLLDPKTVSAAALDSLYSNGCSVLQNSAQAMIEKEIAVYLLAYNLVRWTMAAAATLADVLPRTLSFTAIAYWRRLPINCGTRRASG